MYILIRKFPGGYLLKSKYTMSQSITRPAHIFFMFILSQCLGCLSCHLTRFNQHMGNKVLRSVIIRRSMCNKLRAYSNNLEHSLTFLSLDSQSVLRPSLYALNPAYRYYKATCLPTHPKLLPPSRSTHPTTIMPPISPSRPSPRGPSLHDIYTSWTTALTLPPTPRLSALRRLVNAITSKSASNIVLHPIPLARLFLDLSLTYAYLGEYHLASLGFERAVNADAQRAFALFALGLSRAELGDWKQAKLNWKRCLRCFEQPERSLKSIPYQPFQQSQPINEDDDATTRNIGLGEQWLLERDRVKWNLNMAAFETGDKKAGIKRLGPDDPRQGLNGIPAGLRFGPDGWLNAELERAEAKVFRPLKDIGKPVSARSSPQSSNPSPVMKSLPPLPLRPKASAPRVVSKVWYVDNATLEDDLVPETSSPLTDPAPILSPYIYDSPSSIDQNSLRSGPATSPNSAIPTPLSFYFSDSYEHDAYDEESTDRYSNIDETINNIDEALDDIDDAMSLWTLPLNHPIFTNPHPPLHPSIPHHHYYTSLSPHSTPSSLSNDTTLIPPFLPNDQDLIENKGLDELPPSPPPITTTTTTNEEILLPRVFEGFGPRM